VDEGSFDHGSLDERKKNEEEKEGETRADSSWALFSHRPRKLFTPTRFL